MRPFPKKVNQSINQSIIYSAIWTTDCESTVTLSLRNPFHFDLPLRNIHVQLSGTGAEEVDQTVRVID